jgi:4-hydroxybenzoate polyprenyltransferase
LSNADFGAWLGRFWRPRMAKRGLASRRFFCFHSGAMNQSLIRQLRALLVLGRVSNLPTVWSNCLAGWWLGGGGNFGKLPLLLFGIGALYTGGAFLNDAFDAEFDRQRHAARPIPSGAISLAAVWGWSFAWLGLGALTLAVLGRTPGVLTLALLACIIIYDAIHKGLIASPWLMGLCRFWVYLIAGSTGAAGVNGGPIWCGAALAVYVAGLDSVAGRKSFRGPVPFWPLLLLVTPVFLAMLMNAGEARKSAMLLSLVLLLWIARCARTLFMASGEANVGRIVSGLLAGIVLVDWLAVGPQLPHGLSLAVFLPLFGATLLFQRFVPET